LNGRAKITYKMKKNKTTQLYKVITEDQDGYGELFLYGYIGQDFWWDEELNKESLTDLAFVKALREMEKKYDRIHIRINSPGGSVYHGDPIISAIQQSPAEIHTFNDGMVASMAFDIWMAGNVRHCSSNAKGMCHATSTLAIGTAKDMMNTAVMLEKFDDVAISLFSKASGIDEEEVRARFYDYQDHWMTAKDLKELGLIEDVEDYETKTLPADIEKVSGLDLVKSFLQDLTPQTVVLSEETIQAMKDAFKEHPQAKEVESIEKTEEETGKGLAFYKFNIREKETNAAVVA
jgi:ATP-dependent protease ClpP protease subunit